MKIEKSLIPSASIASALGLPEGTRMTFVVENSTDGSFINCYDVGVYAHKKRMGTVYLWDAVTFREWVFCSGEGDKEKQKAYGRLPLSRDPVTWCERFEKALDKKSLKEAGLSVQDPNIGRRFYLSA